jgi:hypothetical protein
MRMSPLEAGEVLKLRVEDDVVTGLLWPRTDRLEREDDQ